MRANAVHTHFIATPFGNMTYKVSEPETEKVHPKARSYGARTVYFTPVGDMTEAEAIVPLNSGVFTADSTYTPDEAAYEDEPHAFFRIHKPVTVNGKDYRNSFTATRYADGTYLVHSGFHDSFTDSARTKLSDWFTEHDSDVLSPHVLTQLAYDRAYNAHARAQDEQERLIEESRKASGAAFTAWNILQNTPKP